MFKCLGDRLVYSTFVNPLLSYASLWNLVLVFWLSLVPFCMIDFAMATEGEPFLGRTDWTAE